MKHVVKRGGRKEKYDEKKVYASVYAAALNCEYGEKETERIAHQVMKKVNVWVKRKGAIRSEEIRVQILKHLKKEEIALMYQHHLDLS